MNQHEDVDIANNRPTGRGGLIISTLTSQLRGVISGIIYEMYYMLYYGAIQKGRHRGREGGREAKLVTNGDKGGREVT